MYSFLPHILKLKLNLIPAHSFKYDALIKICSASETGAAEAVTLSGTFETAWMGRVSFYILIYFFYI